VGAFYYLRVIKLMYFDPPTEAAAAPSVSQAGVRAVLVVNAAAVLVLGLLPSALIDLCSRLIH
jgi:NADH-quinone oxidoreductase subunit N